MTMRRGWPGCPPPSARTTSPGRGPAPGESIPAGFLHHLRACPSGAGFAAGGVLDTLAPGPWLADALTTATAAATGGHGQLGESELIGVLCGWRRIASWAAAGEAAAVLTLAKRRAAAAPVRPGRGRPSTSPTRSPPR